MSSLRKDWLIVQMTDTVLERLEDEEGTDPSTLARYIAEDLYTLLFVDAGEQDEQGGEADDEF